MNYDKIYNELKEDYDDYEIITIKKTQEEEIEKLEELSVEINNKQFELIYNELINMDFLYLKNCTDSKCIKEYNKTKNIDNLIIQKLLVLSIIPPSLKIEEEIKEDITIEELKINLMKSKRIKLHETLSKIEEISKTINILNEKMNILKENNKEHIEYINEINSQDFKEYLIIQYSDLEEEYKQIEEELLIEQEKLMNYLELKQGIKFE